MRFSQLNRVTVCGFGFAALVLALFASIVVAQGQDTTGFQSFASVLDKPDVAIESSQSEENPPPVAAPCEECEKQAGKTKDALNAAMKDAYKGVFYANDFSYLRNPAYDGPRFAGDSFKGLGDGKLDLGGEYRSRYHHESNMRGLGLTGVDDQFWLSRVRLFSNYRVTENIRVFGEYLYADSGGEEFAPRPIEENRGEFQNLFVDATLFDGPSGFSVGNGMISGERTSLKCKTKNYTNRYLVSPLRGLSPKSNWTCHLKRFVCV